MARLNKIRYRGAIPERQHDAFLLALLIAVSLNVAVVAVQAIMPRLAFLLQLLGPERVELAREEDEMAYPFQLIDASLLDEQLNPDQHIDAESTISRRARQEESRPDLPEATATVDEGIEEILSMQEGNPGPNEASVQSQGESAPEPAEMSEPAPEEAMEEQPPDEEAPETAPVEPQPAPEPIEDELPPPPQEAPEAVMEVVEPPPEPDLQPEPPPVDQSPETIESEPEPVTPLEEEPLILETPPPEPMAEEPPPDASDLKLPDDIPWQEVTVPEPDAESEPEPEPAPPPEPDPPTESEPEPTPAEVIDVASLPITVDGFFDPETRRMEEIAPQAPPPPPPAYRRQEPVEASVVTPPQPQIPVTTPAPPQPEEQTGRRRRSGRQPTFRRIGEPESTQPGQNATAGGAAPRRNTETSIRLLDSDTSMQYLAHRYGEYMAKVARQLQASLNRQMMLSPMSYARGQVKIRFGISPDGSLTFQETVYPTDGEMVAERLMSERMLREAGPFDPLTTQMQQDPNFQRMSVVVNLY